MPLSKSLTAYDNVREILDRVATTGKQARAILPTPGAAVRFRLEAYYYRKLLREKMTITPYDSFRLVISKDAPCVVLIQNAPVVRLEFDDVPIDVGVDMRERVVRSLKGPLATDVSNMWESGAFKSELALWDHFAQRYDDVALEAAFDECGLAVPEEAVPMVATVKED